MKDFTISKVKNYLSKCIVLLMVLKKEKDNTFFFTTCEKNFALLMNQLPF